MAKDTLSRYVWIVDTIRRYGRISRRELNECWARSRFANGETEIPRRTFFNYRIAIEDIFSVSIECDPSTYEYYLVEPGGHDITEWLLNSSATSGVLQGSHDMASRIMLEDVPSAREHLASMIEAIRQNKVVTFDYHPYSRSQPTRGVSIEPYFLRIHRQLWYVTGRNISENKIKTYSLDRIQNLTLQPTTFTPPEDVDPKHYFHDSFGIMVNQSEPKDVRLRVESRIAKYLRALPLHHSQQEMVGDGYSIVTLRLRITTDFVKELLSWGPAITVEAPAELRAMVVEQLKGALKNYGQ